MPNFFREEQKLVAFNLSIPSIRDWPGYLPAPTSMMEGAPLLQQQQLDGRVTRGCWNR